MFNIYIYIN